MNRANDPEVEIKPVDLALLSKPLDFIRADHSRQRALCRVIEDLVRVPLMDKYKAEMVVAQLGNDLGLHVRDEEEDLFPLLRRRCQPGDDIEAILTMLSEQDFSEERLAKEITDALSGLIADGTPVREHPDLQNKMLQFANRQRRHLELENSIVIPIARARLGESDLIDLSKKMAARRGVRMPAPDLGPGPDH